MGIDFSHGAAHWSYSGFHQARNRLAKLVNIPLEDMEGFGGGVFWQDLQNKDDNIIPLLNHSDCEGEIPPDQCATIAPRLRELVSVWPETDYDRIHFELLAQGMEDAALNKKTLEFC